MRRKFLRVATLALLPAVLVGQFLPGLPQIVIDIAQEAHSAQQLADDIKMIDQLIQTYQMITQTYNQIVYNAMYLTNKNAWLGIATQIVNSNTPTTFGETGPWNEAANLGLNIPGAYGLATYAMAPPPFYSAYPFGNSLMSALMASVNIADGSNPAALLSISNSRLNQPMNDLALTNLETTSQDLSLDTNSEVEQLNLANGGLVLMNRQLEDLNAVNTTVAEQQILGNKIHRDSIADAVNFYGQMDMVLAGQPTAWGNSAATITNW